MSCAEDYESCAEDYDLWMVRFKPGSKHWTPCAAVCTFFHEEWTIYAKSRVDDEQIEYRAKEHPDEIWSHVAKVWWFNEKFPNDKEEEIDQILRESSKEAEVDEDSWTSFASHCTGNLVKAGIISPDSMADWLHLELDNGANAGNADDGHDRAVLCDEMGRASRRRFLAYQQIGFTCNGIFPNLNGWVEKGVSQD